MSSYLIHFSLLDTRLWTASLERAQKYSPFPGKKIDRIKVSIKRPIKGSLFFSRTFDGVCSRFISYLIGLRICKFSKNLSNHV